MHKKQLVCNLFTRSWLKTNRSECIFSVCNEYKSVGNRRHGCDNLSRKLTPDLKMSTCLKYIVYFKTLTMLA